MIRHQAFAVSAVSIQLTTALSGFAFQTTRATKPVDLSGTVTFRERIVLPPTAVLDITLEDVSRADAPVDVVAATRNTKPGQPPIRFTLTYDPQRITPSHRYVLRARITVDGQLMFTSNKSYPVLTQGHGTVVDMLVRGVGAPATRTASTDGLETDAPRGTARDGD